MHKLLVTEMNRLTVEQFHESKKLPLTVVLDNVRSLHNIGSVFRTGDAYRVERIILCGMCATPPNQEIHKTALGAELSVDWQYFKSTSDAIDDLQRANYFIAAIEQVEGSISLSEFNRDIIGDRHIAIVLGHEVFGVEQEAVDRADVCVEIPQYGTKHSLNVSVAAGIVMYHINQLYRC